MSLFNFFSSKKEETPFFLNALIQKAIYTTLDSPVIEVLAQTINLDKALALVKEHFTFTADDIANTYQKSYRYALVAISAGLAAPDEKFDFIQQLNQSKLSRDFSDNIESDYLQPFATQCGVKSEVLREQFLEHIKELSSKPLNLQADQSPLSETDLSASLQKQSAITDVILQSIDLKQPQLRDFFCFQELLGYAVLYFFREIIKKDSRVEKTLAALQREGLWADVRDMKTAQETLTVSIQEEINTLKAIAIKSIENGDFSKPEQLQPQLTRLQTSIDDVPKRLQTAQASLQEIIDFSHRFENWTALLETKVEEVLIALDVLQWTIGKIDNNVEMLLQEFRQFMLRCHLSPQIKMSDEFTYHDSESRQLIKSTVNKLKALPFHKTRYNQVVMMAGSVLSSTGDIVESEKFFLQAQNNAQNSEEKALASFNLFQAQLRNQEYEKALSNLCTAIDINASHYALHDIDRYPIIR
ncbi:MAG: hypothetical protein KAH77_04540, partial [Thiomargarita sp.]|nr:hypothetical protein [Thiomargarita sp.]